MILLIGDPKYGFARSSTIVVIYEKVVTEFCYLSLAFYSSFISHDFFPWKLTSRFLKYE